MMYRVVSSRRELEFQAKVQELIDQGWEPLGGVSLATIPSMLGADFVYAQALTLTASRTSGAAKARVG